MKLIYLGYAVPKEIERTSKAVSVAGNNMEISLLKGLNEIYGENLYPVTVIPIGSYPKEKKIIINSKIYSLGPNLKTHTIGLINIPIIKQLTIMFSIFFIIIKKIIEFKNNNKQEQIFIMTYNSASILSVPLFLASAFFKIFKLCLVVDIPINFQKKKNFILEIVRYIDNYVSLQTFKVYDAMITLVEKTVLDFSPGTPYLVIDYSLKQNKESALQNMRKTNYIYPDKFIMSYTGALEVYYGITHIIEAMSILPSNYELHLYGKGSLKHFIEQRAEKNNRIIFHGLVSNEQARKAQAEASLLLLLRTDAELNKYALPSKVIEYLASGTPIISTSISSIPRHLNKYINFVENETPDAIAKAILELTKDEDTYYKILEKAKLGQKYVLQNCLWEKQAKKISGFIEKFIKK